MVRPVATVAALSGLQFNNTSLYWSPCSRPFAPGSSLPWLAKPAHCGPKLQALPCSVCGECLPTESFSGDQRRRSSRKCIGGAARETSLQCTACGESLPPELFAGNQRKLSTRTCIACIGSRPTPECKTQCEYLTCTRCAEVYPRESFSQQQLAHATHWCKSCCPATGAPAQPHSRIDVGEMLRSCTYCEARLLSCETSAFFCGHGKHHIDFASMSHRGTL